MWGWLLSCCACGLAGGRGRSRWAGAAVGAELKRDRAAAVPCMQLKHYEARRCPSRRRRPGPHAPQLEADAHGQLPQLRQACQAGQQLGARQPGAQAQQLRQRQGRGRAPAGRQRRPPQAPRAPCRPALQLLVHRQAAGVGGEAGGARRGPLGGALCCSPSLPWGTGLAPKRRGRAGRALGMAGSWGSTPRSRCRQPLRPLARGGPRPAPGKAGQLRQAVEVLHIHRLVQLQLLQVRQRLQPEQHWLQLVAVQPQRLRSQRRRRQRQRRSRQP
jgi:hypothetical protein